MTSFYDQMQHDVAFRAFINAQIGQAGVELAALKIEHDHALAIIESQKARLAELEPQPKRRKTQAG